jgi:methylated-DNA-protein-cysteine methyltransferase-like protein
MPGEVFARVYALVRRIPRGRVATYGLLSSLLDGRLSAAAVGWAMRAAPPDLPWHRVVNAAGGLSTEASAPGEQRARLAAEGVTFGADGRVDLHRHLWRPRLRRRRFSDL